MLKASSHAMEGVKPFQIYKGDEDLLNWGWLKVQRRLSRRYADNEYHVTLKLPIPRRRFFDPAYDEFGMGKPALFVAFGRVSLAPKGWHARGAVIHVDAYHRPYTPPEPIGYKNPINLANYS